VLRPPFSRLFARQLVKLVGPHVDIAGPVDGVAPGISLGPAEQGCVPERRIDFEPLDETRNVHRQHFASAPGDLQPRRCLGLHGADQRRFAHRSIFFHFARSRTRFAAIHFSGRFSLPEGRIAPVTSSVSISTVQQLPSRNSTRTCGGR
jgi:hypothetical protein